MNQSVLVRFVIVLLLASIAAACSIPTYSDLTKTVKTISLKLPAPKAVESAWSEQELRCLARMVYGEARNQPFEGQVAVAAVAVSRSLNPNWPKDLCDVVRQPKQFSGYWAASEPPSGPYTDAWQSAFAAADMATRRYTELPSSYRRIFYFTVRHERSSFHRKLPLQGYIADHAFYREKAA